MFLNCSVSYSADFNAITGGKDKHATQQMFTCMFGLHMHSLTMQGSSHSLLQPVLPVQQEMSCLHPGPECFQFPCCKLHDTIWNGRLVEAACGALQWQTTEHRSKTVICRASAEARQTRGHARAWSWYAVQP